MLTDFWVAMWLIGLTILAVLDGFVADYRYRQLDRRITKLEEER